VRHVQQQLGISERRACRALDQPRSSQRYVARRAPEEEALVKRMRELARKHRRYGFRRIHALLVREGWRVNRKRVQRLWRAEGLKVVRRQRKRRRQGSSENGCGRHQAESRNHVWSYDFTMDQTADGKRLKLMPVVDEFTRECLSIEVERSITAQDVIATLNYLFRVHGEPAYIRSDNGPEFIAKAIQEWLAVSGVKTLYIEPGSPWENAYVESFNGKLEDELLGGELFTSLLEARVVIEQYRVEYNHERPHSSLGYRTPAEFAASCRSPDAAGAAEMRLPSPSFPHAAAGSCTKVLSSQRVENSLTCGLP
jgi:putative transposase